MKSLRNCFAVACSQGTQMEQKQSRDTVPLGLGKGSKLDTKLSEICGKALGSTFFSFSNIRLHPVCSLYNLVFRLQ